MAGFDFSNLIKRNEFIYNKEDIKLSILLLKAYHRVLEDNIYESEEELMRLKSLIDGIIERLDGVKIEPSDKGIEEPAMITIPHAEELRFEDVRDISTAIESYIHERTSHDLDERSKFLSTVLKTLMEVKEVLTFEIDLVNPKEQKEGIEPGD